MSNTKTTIRFKCPVCEQANEQVISVPDVDWTCEPMSDSLSEEDDVVICQGCQEHLSVHIQNSPSTCSVEFEDYPRHPIEADDAPFATEPENLNDNDWLRWDVPSHPYDELRDAVIGLRNIVNLDAATHERLPNLLKMAYAQIIAAMEAYLGDTLINGVMVTQDRVRKMATGEGELKKERLSLDAVLANPNVAHERVGEYLREVLYHNLAKADVLYNIAFGFQLLTDQLRNKRMFTAILLRHDIVHRNGKSKEGKQVSIKPSDANQLIDDVLSLARDVESNLRRASM